MLRLIVLFLVLTVQLGLNAAADVENVLSRLAQRCRASKSDAVLITHYGKVLFEYRTDCEWIPMETMSMTKSITALAVGMLIDEGKIPSVDTPVYEFYPEWEQGLKRFVTIRHLLSHTSGIEDCDDLDVLYRIGNIIQTALCANVTSVPGSCFQYNNTAVNLLSGIVEKASGMPMSQYLALRMFTPMGIQNVSWLSDPCGNEYAMSHMIMSAPDLAKIGEMLANGGVYNCRRYLSQGWINFLMKPSQNLIPFCGHLWWLDYYCIRCNWSEAILCQYEEAGINPRFIQRLRDLQGREIATTCITTTPDGACPFVGEATQVLGGEKEANCFWNELRTYQLPMGEWRAGGLRAYAAKGAYGQQLIIFPGKNIVAVRQVRVKGDKCVDSFHDFAAFVEELAYSMGL